MAREEDWMHNGTDGHIDPFFDFHQRGVGHTADGESYPNPSTSPRSGPAMADLAACRAGVDAGVAYYGRMIVDWLDSKPACPVMYHFGDKDPLIPPETVQAIREGRPEGVFFKYAAAGHGFNCDERDDYEPDSAALALERTLAFLNDNL